MIQITSIIIIYRPVKQVFEFISTPENDFQWQYGTLASTRLPGKTIGLGSCFQSIGNFMGQRIQTTFEVTDYMLNIQYGFKSLSGPLQSLTYFAFNMVAGGTQVKLSMQLNPVMKFDFSESIMEKKMKRQFKENLTMLKNILEGE